MKIKLLLSGMVQGVGCRWFVEEIAKERGIKGQVKNLSDGRVEIYAELEENQLNEFIKALKAGKDMVNVTEIEQINEDDERYEPAPAFEEFKITY